MNPLRLVPILSLTLALQGSPVAAEPSMHQAIREMNKVVVSGFAIARTGEMVVSSTSLYRSHDGGKSWGRVGPEIDVGGPVHGGQDGTLLATGVIQFTPEGKSYPEGQEHAGLYRSTDGGATWKEILGGPVKDLPLTALATSLKGIIWVGLGQPFGGDNVATGLQRSTDGGKSWKRLWPGKQVLALQWTPAGLYAGTGEGAFVSHDDGETFTDLHVGKAVAALRVGRGRTLFASTFEGLLRSTDGGKSWKPTELGPQDPIPLPAFLPNGDMVALVNAPASPDGPVLKLSRDDGTSWTPLASKFVDRMVDVFYVAGGTFYLTTRGRGVLRSRDGGKTFETLFP